MQRFALIIGLLLALFPVAGSEAVECLDCDGDGISWPADCNDADAQAYMGATEACDGIDNDCDGLIDEDAGCQAGCASPDRRGPERRLTEGLSFEPSLAWSGSEFGVAWTTNYQIYFARLTPAGDMIGSPRLVSSDSRWTRRPSLVWTGSEFGLAWDREFEVYFAALDRQGAIRVPERRVTASTCDALTPSLVWNGNEYGLAWEDCRDDDWEIYFARIDRDGLLLPAGPSAGTASRVTDSAGNSLSPQLAWTGSSYAMVWHDLRQAAGNGGNYEIFFAGLDAEGTKLGEDRRLTTAVGSGFSPMPVWTGNEIGVSWIDRRDDPSLVRGKAYFSLVDDLGGSLLEDCNVTPAHPEGPPWPIVDQARLAWTGNEFGLVTVALDLLQGSGYETYLQRISLEGEPLEEPRRLSLRDGSGWNPVLAWTGQGYGVAWDDNRRGTREIFFAEVACGCGEDRDGDGASACSDCNESRPDIYPDAIEACNRADSDCDGEVDDACLNRPPVAEAGAGMSTECEAPLTRVTLDGRASFDPDAGPLQYTWVGPFPEGGGVVMGERAEVSLPVGTSQVHLTVTDGFGGVDTDVAVIRIVDSRPPILSLAATPTIIWPPDHRLVEADVIASAEDLCGSASVFLRSLVSSEAPSIAGGRSRGASRDIVGAETDQTDFSFQLRAERDPQGQGRMYTAVYEAIDEAGHSTTASINFLVPHDLRFSERSRRWSQADSRAVLPPTERRDRARKAQER